MDFKVRVLDFISIYVQQRSLSDSSGNSDSSLKLIQGLLAAMKVAHQDNHQILFDRVKSVLTTMSKQGISSDANQSAEALKD